MQPPVQQRAAARVGFADLPDSAVAQIFGCIGLQQR